MAKPIKVHITQGTTTSASKVVLGGILECNKAKFTKNFTICALDGIEGILGNTFLDVYRVHVLRGGFKLRVISRLANRFVGLKGKYQASLTKLGR